MSARLVADTLEEYGSITRASLFDYLPAGPHSHSLYELCADYPRRGGRAMRPSLCIAAACAFGRPVRDALRTAVSIELIHNAMLIHDDIEDESELRRGQPALHVTAGTPIAINVGDALAMVSLRPLIENRERLGPLLALQLLEAAERMTRESAEGQAIELEWRRDNPLDVREADYLHMVLKKTCWLATIFPLQAGSLIGSLGVADVQPILRFGFMLGAAFQIQDDLLNLVGDQTRYGKELGGDIYEGKRTLMLIRLFALATHAERARLHTLLGRARAQRSARDVEWVREAMEQYDCIEYARKFAQGLAGAARHEFAVAFGRLPDSRDKQFIAALPAWVIERV
jgi:geranylgeranyl diphosphate synthase, type II